VSVVGWRVPQGYQIAVIDQGLGLDELSLDMANARIRDAASTPSALTDSKLLGLNVVGRLADRHNTRVQLTPHPSGGLVAVVLLPRALVALPPSSAGIITAPSGPLPESAAPALPPAPAAPVVPAPPVDAGPPNPDDLVLPPPPVAAVSASGPPPPDAANGTAPVHVNGNGTATPETAPPVMTPTAAADESVSGLRRRVRLGDGAPAPTATEVVHGPARSADDVRNSWSALAQGVEQARSENAEQPTAEQQYEDDPMLQEGSAP
jgi:hypothetical protein